MEKIKIVAIVGMSGSGKTYASQFMEVCDPAFHTIVSFTTRPIRSGEINGVDHWFVTQNDKPDTEDIVAYTVYGGYEYWTRWSQFYNRRYYNVYVIDENGLVDLISNPAFNERVELIPVKIYRENRSDIDDNRKIRDKERAYIEDSFYSYIVNNDGTLQNFQDTIRQLCKIIKSR